MKNLLSTTAFMLAITFTGTAFAHMGDGMEWDNKPDGPGFEKAISSLPPKDAQQLRDTLREARDENGDMHEREHQLRRDLHAILVAPRFDEQAYVAKSKELEQLRADMELNKTEAFASVAGDLTQPQREHLAHAMMHNPPHPPHPPHHGPLHKSPLEQLQNDNESSESPPKPPMQ